MMVNDEATRRSRRAGSTLQFWLVLLACAAAATFLIAASPRFDAPLSVVRARDTDRAGDAPLWAGGVRQQLACECGAAAAVDALERSGDLQ